jgi:hypothetical protein
VPSLVRWPFTCRGGRVAPPSRDAGPALVGAPGPVDHSVLWISGSRVPVTNLCGLDNEVTPLGAWQRFMGPAALSLSIVEGEESLGPSESSRASLPDPREDLGGERGWSRGVRLIGWLGMAAGAVATGLPSAIGILRAAWFGFSDAMDPPFVWFMVAAVLGWLAASSFSARSRSLSSGGRGPWASGTSPAPRSELRLVPSALRCSAWPPSVQVRWPLKPTAAPDVLDGAGQRMVVIAHPRRGRQA